MNYCDGISLGLQYATTYTNCHARGTGTAICLDAFYYYYFSFRAAAAPHLNEITINARCKWTFNELKCKFRPNASWQWHKLIIATLEYTMYNVRLLGRRLLWIVRRNLISHSLGNGPFDSPRGTNILETNSFQKVPTITCERSKLRDRNYWNVLQMLKRIVQRLTEMCLTTAFFHVSHWQ